MSMRNSNDTIGNRVKNGKKEKVKKIEKRIKKKRKMRQNVTPKQCKEL
jgi:hypothetical protein